MDIKSMTLPELQEEMAAIGEKSFRAISMETVCAFLPR